MGVAHLSGLAPGKYTVYALSWDGRLRQVNAADGQDVAPPEKFIPGGGKPYALNLYNGVIYTATAQGCGGLTNAFYSFDLASRKASAFIPAGGGLWGRRGASISSPSRRTAPIKRISASCSSAFRFSSRRRASAATSAAFGTSTTALFAADLPSSLPPGMCHSITWFISVLGTRARTAHLPESRGGDGSAIAARTTVVRSECRPGGDRQRPATAGWLMPPYRRSRFW